MTIEKHYVNAAEAAEKLRAIHADVQDKIHDQWDWMQAEFYVSILHQAASDQDDTIKQRDELWEDGCGQPASAEIHNIPPITQTHPDYEEGN
jgi:hypothetical protein